MPLLNKQLRIWLLRYVYLALGGCVLAMVSMGSYCWLVFVPVGASAVLVPSARSLHAHTCVFGAQMCWQTGWHLFIQYKEYWLQEPVDTRLLIAVSSLMLLTQRITSVSMDLQEGKLTGTQSVGTTTSALAPHLAGTQSVGSATSALQYLSYTLYFPGLLGGPLCSFQQFVSFVEQRVSPAPQPLYAVCCKVCWTLGLQWGKCVLVDVMERYSPGLAQLSAVQSTLWVLGLALVFRLSYYSHWALSAGLNNAAGLGFRGYSGRGVPRWDGVSDGDPWTLETCSRPSAFARHWNGTTAAWLRRAVFQRCRTAPLAMTFGFSAWWHGLHPGQVLGFLLWGVAVKADYRIHQHVRPLLTSPATQQLYRGLGWAHTQLLIACVVVAVELRGACFMWLLWKTHISVFLLLYVILLFFLPQKHP
ncbi:ghrelin O-acyltransferase [Anguilla anguilla]|uniref:ghrelin O-acyltransferase n=1 Tax=Anguilla anguilla TaxID=7936 RepID=UPI0015AB355F|nr:ghrelin O-acyltransferase [Anguilla anguilla]